MGDVRIQTSHASCGRNIWASGIEYAEIRVWRKGGGFHKWIIGEDVKSHEWQDGNKKGIDVYGEFGKRWVDGKKVKHVRYRAKSNMSVIPDNNSQTYKDELGPYKGVVRNKNRGDTVMVSRFYYDNRKMAYKVARWHKGKKTRTMYYPDKKVWVEWTGAVDVQIPFTLINAEGQRWSNWKKPNKSERKVYELIPNFTRSEGDGTFTTYDRAGKVRNKGQFVRRQRVGEWIFAGKPLYYMSGVKVSANLFKAKPEDINPAEILDIENVQLRGALLSKVGLDRVLQKVGGKEVDKQGDMSLVVLPVKAQGNNDQEIRLLKVRCPSTGTYFTLRVPPNMSKCEEARQWTFGVNQPSAAGNNYLKLETET